MSIAAYKATIRESENARQIERRILSRVTGELERRAGDFDETESRTEKVRILSSGLRESLIENQTFWQALKHSLASEGNQLPDELRAKLLSMCLWVETQTNSVLGGQPGVGALVAVNQCIVQGLGGTPPGPRR